MGLNYLTLSDYSRYHIYDDGRIFDLKYNRFMPQQINPDGYCTCTLSSDFNKRKTFRVHRLVAICFIENVENKAEVNHKDGIKTNNHFLNLEWCSHSENIQHAWDTGLIKNTEERVCKLKAQTLKKGKDNPKSKPVILLNTGEVFESGGIASQVYNVRQEQLNRCCNPKHPAKYAGKDINGIPLRWAFYKMESN